MNKQKTILITGASSGIGLATARLLVENDWQVWGTSRHPDQQVDKRIHWLQMDVRDTASVQSAIKRMFRDVIKLDAVVNNAGYGVWGSVEELDMDTARYQFDTNVFGVLRVIQAVLPHMREARSGNIINIGSLAGRAPIPFQSHYSATKAAIDSFSQALRMELHPFNIKVTLVEPGNINTPFNDNMDWSFNSSDIYGQRIKSCEQVVRDELPRSPGPELIAKTVYKVLRTRHPKMRYAAGPDSFLVGFGRRFFPEALALRMIRNHFNI